MLRTLPSDVNPNDDLLVAYDANPGAVMAHILRLIHAYDPIGHRPMAGVVLWDTLPDFDGLVAKLGELQARFARPHELDARRPGGADPIDDPLAYAAQWLTLGHGIATGIAPMLRPVNTGNIYPQLASEKIAAGIVNDFGLDAQNAIEKGSWAWGPDPSSPSQTIVLDHAFRNGITYLILWFGFHKWRTSTWLTGEVDAPKGVPKSEYALLERVLRLTTLIKVIHDQSQLLELRSRVRFLLEPALGDALTVMGDLTLERFREVGSRVLSLPMHPWYAECERVLQAAKRYTAWGTATETVGLIRWGAFQKLLGASASRGTKPTATELDLASFFQGTYTDLQRWELSMLQLKPENVTQAMATAGFVGAGAPPRMHLHGQTFIPFVSDGVDVVPTPSDIVELMSNVVAPAANPDGSSVMATNLLVQRYLSGSVIGLNKPQPGDVRPHWEPPAQPPPLFIQPERPELDSSWMLKDLTGMMIRPMWEAQFWGEIDIIRAVYTPDGVASIMGSADPWELITGTTKGAARAVLPEFAHLFELSNGDLVPTVPTAKHVFVSPRTRRPWLLKAQLSLYGIPSKTVALSSRVPPISHAIQALITTDAELPRTQAPLDPIVTAGIDKVLAWTK